MSGATFEFTDRYKASGIPYPDAATMCKGQCEGMGVVPVHKDMPNDHEGAWHDLWLKAEAKDPTDDGWHFIVCPTCKGTRKRQTV